MLEVHPPDEPAHSWKDFLLHIGTICVGLLIAIGLEQSVEAVHRAHERRDLREELEHESEQIRKDSESCTRAAFTRANWAGSAMLTISTAAREKRSLQQLPPTSGEGGVFPSDPIFRGAMASNRLPLLTRAEVEAYSEMHLLVEELEKRTTHESEADVEFAVAVTNLSFGMDPNNPTLLTGVNAANLKEPYQALVRVQRAYFEAGQYCYVMRYAAKAIHDGERDLGNIEAAETKAQAALRQQITASQRTQTVPNAATAQQAQEPQRPQAHGPSAAEQQKR